MGDASDILDSHTLYTHIKLSASRGEAAPFGHSKTEYSRRIAVWLDDRIARASSDTEPVPVSGMDGYVVAVLTGPTLFGAIYRKVPDRFIEVAYFGAAAGTSPDAEMRWNMLTRNAERRGMCVGGARDFSLPGMPPAPWLITMFLAPGPGAEEAELGTFTEAVTQAWVARAEVLMQSAGIAA